MLEECLFCKFVKDKSMLKVIYEDKDTLAFLDIRPASPKGGHTLVIPKKHYKLITEIPEKELTALMKTVQKVTKSVLKFSEGANVLSNNERPAGQAIMHAHFHVIPRFKGDNIKIEEWDGHPYKDGEMTKVMNKLKSFLE